MTVMATYRVAIDRSLCSGFALCVEDAPDVFALDDLGKSTLLVPGNTNDQHVLEAAADCPTNAISIFDSEGGERVA